MWERFTIGSERWSAREAVGGASWQSMLVREKTPLGQNVFFFLLEGFGLGELIDRREKTSPPDFYRYRWVVSTQHRLPAQARHQAAHSSRFGGDECNWELFPPRFSLS